MSEGEGFHCRVLSGNESEGASDCDEGPEFESSEFFNKWLNRIERESSKKRKKGVFQKRPPSQVKDKRRRPQSYLEELNKFMMMEDNRDRHHHGHDAGGDDARETGTAEDGIVHRNKCSGRICCSNEKDTEMSRWPIDNEEYFVYGWLYNEPETNCEESSDCHFREKIHVSSGGHSDGWLSKLHGQTSNEFYYSGWLYRSEATNDTEPWSNDNEEQFVYRWLFDETEESAISDEENFWEEENSATIFNGTKVPLPSKLWNCLADITPAKSRSLLYQLPADSTIIIEGTVAWTDQEKIAIQTVSIYKGY